MSYTYTVKAGDSLNAIAQAHGFSNYKDAGIASVPSGDFNLIRPNEQITLGNYDPNKVSTVPTKTSPIISSTDNQQQFRNDSTSIDTLIGSLNTKVDPVTGQPVKEEKKTETPVVKTDGTTTETGTGDIIYDNAQKVIKEKKEALRIEEENKKTEYKDLFNTGLANLNATTQSTINTINTLFDRRIKERVRLNDLSTASVQAYGLSNGGQYTPIAFKDAITAREQEGADYISELELQRNDLIDKAKTARNEGETGMMRQYLQDNQKIEDKINEALKNVVAISNEESKNNRELIKEAEVKRKAKIAENMTTLGQISSLMADEYSVLDQKGKEEKIKKLMMAYPNLDYPSIAYTLENAVTQKAKEAFTKLKDEASLRSTEELINQRKQPKKSNNGEGTITERRSSDISVILNDFSDKMKKNNWKGANPDAYNDYKKQIFDQYGTAGVTELDKAMEQMNIRVTK